MNTKCIGRSTFLSRNLHSSRSLLSTSSTYTLASASVPVVATTLRVYFYHHQFLRSRRSDPNTKRDHPSFLHLHPFHSIRYPPLDGGGTLDLEGFALFELSYWTFPLVPRRSRACDDTPDYLRFYFSIAVFVRTFALLSVDGYRLGLMRIMSRGTSFFGAELGVVDSHTFCGGR